MAIFVIPSNWTGKTLKQIGDEIARAGGYIPRLDLIAEKAGTDINTPLKPGQTFEWNDPGAGEQIWLKQHTKETSVAEIEAQKILDAQKKVIDEEKKFIEKYKQDNPFVFDEELARQSATAEYEPYYSELLQDYLGQTESQRQTVQDEQKLAQDLYKLDTSARSRAYERAIGEAERGFAGSGLFFSGIKERTTGQQEVEYGSESQRASGQYGTQQAGFERTLGDIGTAEQQKTRDIGREQQASIESGVLKRESEAEKGYYTPLIQSYYRQFPTSSGNVLQGYVVPDYLQF